MIHEDLAREETVAAPSERSFGVVFAAVAALIAAWAAWKGRPAVALAGALAAPALLAAALLRPALLAVPNRLWFRFGMKLSRVVQPVAMAIMFFAIVTPIGLLMRLTGGDPLRLKRRAGADSYWIAREPPGPEPGSFRNQF